MRHSPALFDAAGAVIDSFPYESGVRRLFDGSGWYVATTAAERGMTDTAFAAAVTAYKVGLPGPSAYNIGAYYFPGWVDGVVAARPLPWALLDAWPDRWPMQGRYQEGSQHVARNQLREMAYAGIDFIAIDWYWHGSTFLDNAVEAFKVAMPAISSPVKYCLMWDNSLSSGSYPTSLGDWTNIYTNWITNHFKNGGSARPEYYTIDGKPVVILFSPDSMRLRANALYPAFAANETATLQMLNAANSAAIAAGLLGIYFIACMKGQTFWVGTGKYLAINGYSAQTAYLNHNELSDKNMAQGPLAQNYAELDQINRNEWEWNIANSALPYFLPITAGWDRRPWGGSNVEPYNNAGHDNCTPTSEEWRGHLAAAKSVLDANAAKTLRTMMIYAMNERGEGGFIEPSIYRKTERLDDIRAVFGT